MRSTVGIALRCFLFCGNVEGKTAPGFGIASGTHYGDCGGGGHDKEEKERRI